MMTHDIIRRLKEVCDDANKVRNNFVAIRCSEAILHIEHLQAKLDNYDEILLKLKKRNKKK